MIGRPRYPDDESAIKNKQRQWWREASARYYLKMKRGVNGNTEKVQSVRSDL